MEGAKILAPYLTILYRRFLTTGEVPEINNLSWIVPLLKPGKDAGDPESYRPVALIEIIWRVFEKLLKPQLMEHAEHNNLFRDRQHGFRQSKSTVSNLLRQQAYTAREVAKGATVDSVYLDYSKAFDLVSHHLLVKCLKQSGIHGNLLRILSRFLYGRQQQVMANGRLSTKKPVERGTPQGSCLSPYLFSIFVAGVAKELEEAERQIREAE